MPGTTVERNSKILFEFLLILLIESKLSCKISKDIDPSLLEGVGSDKKIKSDSFTVSSRLFKDFDSSLS